MHDRTLCPSHTTWIGGILDIKKWVTTYGVGCVDVGRCALWAGCGLDVPLVGLWWMCVSEAALCSDASCSPWSDKPQWSCETSSALHKSKTTQPFTSQMINITKSQRHDHTALLRWHLVVRGRCGMPGQWLGRETLICGDCVKMFFKYLVKNL